MLRRAPWLLLALAAAACSAPPPPPANIVLIVGDDMAVSDVGASGGTVARTPNLDRLAAEGVRFDQAYAASPDVFAAQVSRGAPAGGRPERGGDLFGEIALSFEEAVRGTERRLTVTRLDVCGDCGGAGRRRAAETRCGGCQGSGATRRRRGHMVFAMRCAFCEGTGSLRFRPCAACRESGIAARDEEIAIHVPAGVDDGSRLRIEAKGNAGIRGGEPGDLYIVAKVGRHRVLRREGPDLHVDLPIAIHEAALGAAVDVPTLDGPARLRVPPGTRSGQRFRLREHGVPSPRRDGGRGDLVVAVHVVLPAVDDERSKALLREFGRIHGADVRKDLFED